MYNNILVAIDNNEHAKKIVETAIETALAFNCKLTLCHIKKNTIIYNPVDPTGMLVTPHIFSQDFLIQWKRN